MKKLLLLFAISITIIACKNEPKRDYALFSGKVENGNSDKAILKGINFNQEITINADGTFSDTLKLAETGFYNLSIGRESTTIYLKNGNNLNLAIDTKEFDETIKYTGEGAIENNYLATKYLNIETLRGTSNEFFGLDEEAFKQKVNTIKDSNSEALNSLEYANEDFVATETKNLEYDSYALLNSYERSHAYYVKKKDFKASEGFFPEAFKNITFDDANAYKMSASYKQMAFGKVIDDLFKTIGDDYQNASVEQLSTIKDIKITALKNEVISYLGGFLVSPGNSNMKSVYEFFVENSTDEVSKEKIKATYEKVKDLVKGNPSPVFTNYENHKGGETSLVDLKGKYVYVDVWATWCGPCKREIPYLKEVEKSYHGKNIEFVSTSIDRAKDHEAWTKMVNDKDLGGVQLFADNDWKSKFITDYAIQGIPRFILVDPEGNIVSADAPRPSNPKLVELFEELGIK